MIDIRLIKETDIDCFHAALSSVVLERKYLLTVNPPSKEDTGRFIKRNIENNTPQYVAELENKVIGWADVIAGEKEIIRHVGLLGMGVVSGHRRKGIGQKLLSAVVEHSWNAGFKRLELEVFASNKGAYALYEKNGFELEGTKRNSRYMNGEYEDVYLMAQCRI